MLSEFPTNPLRASFVLMAVLLPASAFAAATSGQGTGTAQLRSFVPQTAMSLGSIVDCSASSGAGSPSLTKQLRSTSPTLKGVGIQTTLKAFVPPGPLACPAVPSTPVRLPSPPYNSKAGDCALMGRGAEVEAYLQALEDIATACYCRRDEAWDAVGEARDALDAAIDALPDESGSSFSLACMGIPDIGDIGDLMSGFDDEGFHYTRWLERITENVVKYCRLVDELMEPIAEACEETEEEVVECGGGGASDALRDSYHRRVNWAMNAANYRYDYTEFFFENTLQHYGWGNFREYFRDGDNLCRQEGDRFQDLPVPSGSATPRTPAQKSVIMPSLKRQTIAPKQSKRSLEKKVRKGTTPTRAIIKRASSSSSSSATKSK